MAAGAHFWTFLAIHVLIWWLLPALLQHNLPLDVIEQLAWGREWQIVYFKHPPLPAWIVEVVATVSGRWPPALYLVGPLASALSLFAVWRLGRAMLGEQRALLAVLAQEGVVYFTIFTPEFNHNVVLLPLWAALGLAGYRACFEPGSPRAACGRWAWFGVLAALGMLGKYTTALLLLPLLLLARAASSPAPCLGRPRSLAGDGRRAAAAAAASAGLVADRLCAAAVPVRACAGADAIGTTTSSTRCCSPRRSSAISRRLCWRSRCWHGGDPANSRRCRSRSPLPPEQRAYLATITWAPVGLAVAASVVLGLHLKDMWGYPMWCFIGLFLMAEVVGPFTAGGRQRFCRRLADHPDHRADRVRSAADHRRPVHAQAVARGISRPGAGARGGAAVACGCR